MVFQRFIFYRVTQCDFYSGAFLFFFTQINAFCRDRAMRRKHGFVTWIILPSSFVVYAALLPIDWRLNIIINEMKPHFLYCCWWWFLIVTHSLLTSPRPLPFYQQSSLNSLTFWTRKIVRFQSKLKKFDWKSNTLVPRVCTVCRRSLSYLTF